MTSDQRCADVYGGSYSACGVYLAESTRRSLPPATRRGIARKCVTTPQLRNEEEITARESRHYTIRRPR
jgi:hypothetical protein